VLGQQPFAAPTIRSGFIRSGLGQDLDAATRNIDRHQTEADQSAEPVHAPITIPAPPCGLPMAMLAQSIGGGGGDGGDASSITQSIVSPTVAATVTVGGTVGKGGDGGTADAANSGVLITVGEHFYGIAAQSIGGGGGQGGAALLPTRTGSASPRSTAGVSFMRQTRS
jgi:hypothetical protein